MKSVASVPLGDLIHPAKLRRAGGRELPILSMTMREGLVDQANKFKKRVASTDTSGYKVVARGQLVVGFPIDEGVLSVQDLYEAAIVSPAYGIWDICEGRVLPEYLERFLRSPRALSYYAQKLRGTTARRRTLPDDLFLALLVPLPPLLEQRRISDILDKSDAIRSKRKEAIALSGELLRSAFLEMFGDPATNPKGWSVKPLGETFADDPRIGTLVPASKQAGTIVVRVGELGQYDVALGRCKRAVLSPAECERFLAETGDVLLARAIGSEGHLGKASVLQPAPEPVVFDSHVMRLRFRPYVLDPYFFVQWLRSSGGRTRFMREAGRTAVQFNVNGKQIARVKIPLPPMTEQRRFLAVFSGVRRCEGKAASSLVEAETLFLSLVQRAFSGDFNAAEVSC